MQVFRSLVAQYPFLVLFVGGIVMTVADFFAKKWSIGGSAYAYAGAFVLYFLALNTFVFSLGTKHLAVANALLVTMNTAFLVLLGFFYFHEKLSPVQSAGLLLSVVAVVMLEWGS